MPIQAPIGFKRGLFLRVWDIALPIAGLWLAESLHPYQTKLDLMILASCVLVPLIGLVFQTTKAYELERMVEPANWCFRALLAWALVLAGFIGVLYLMHQSKHFPRLMLGPWALGSGVVLVLGRLLLWLLLRRAYGAGSAGHRIVIAGDHGHCRRLAQRFDKHPELGIRVLGIVTDEVLGDGEGDRWSVLGAIGELGELVEQEKVHMVLVAVPLERHHVVKEVTDVLIHHPIVVQFAPDLRHFSMIGFRAVDYAGIPVFNLISSPLGHGALTVKWLEDKIFGLLALVLASPVMILAALLIKVSSRGPIFFVQERHGLYGRPIRVYKFRSMRMADSAEAQTGREAHADGTFRQATKGDSRITWIGRIMRTTSIDELPQLFNVLKGDMSLVGPRPHAIHHNEQFVETVDALMQRHYLKPGITGLAQISGFRGETRTIEDMQRRVAYDLDYVRNWSFWLDIRILVLTVFKGFINRQP